MTPVRWARSTGSTARAPDVVRHVSDYHKSHRHRPDERGVMTETAQNFTERADAFAAILDATDQQWDAPTPCDGWTVRDVVEHAIDTERDFLAAAGARPRPGARPRRPGRRVALPRGRRSPSVLGREGVAEREYDGYFGRTTIAATMADFYGWDLVIHGSDIARATGQSWSISDDEAARPARDRRRLGRRALLRGRLRCRRPRARRRLRHRPSARPARARPAVATRPGLRTHLGPLTPPSVGAWHTHSRT